jgi:HSP20 family molecular chaperone IbpA
MSLFPKSFYEPETSFTPLFRLLDDFDNYSRQTGASHLESGGRSGATVWQPKFDIHESSGSYELHGEFPGVNKDEIHIEFPESQTLSIHGKAERTYSVGTSPRKRIEDASDKPSPTTDSGDGAGNRANASAQDAARDTAKAEQPKYWLRERKVGQFSRTFTFPAPVDQDNISAHFQDGILSITVPKAQKPQPRRIAIS